MEIWKSDDNSQIVYVHDVSECSGQDRPCTIHRPSMHYLSLSPQLWNDRRGLMERKCVHGQMHIDPDEIVIPEDAVDGCWDDCDNCCRTEPDALEAEIR